MVLLSLSLKRMDPFTVQAEVTPSCCFIADSFWKVALVRSSKNGNFMRDTLEALLLVLLEVVEMDSLGANSFRLRNTRFLQ